MSALPRSKDKAQYKALGPFGPAYEIVRVLRDLPDGDKMLLIRVVETNEEAEYKLSDATDDPEAA